MPYTQNTLNKSSEQVGGLSKLEVVILTEGKMMRFQSVCEIQHLVTVVTQISLKSSILFSSCIQYECIMIEKKSDSLKYRRKEIWIGKETMSSIETPLLLQTWTVISPKIYNVTENPQIQEHNNCCLRFCSTN